MGIIPDDIWDKFASWCKAQYSLWSPDRSSINLWEEWKKTQGDILKDKEK